MDNTFLYTIPQWIIFAGIFVSVYGWVERKKAFRLIGCSLFVILGLYSFYILSGDFFEASKFLTPEELARIEIDEETLDEMPFVAQLLPAYWSFIVSAVLAVPGLFLEWKNKKTGRIFIIAMGLVSLLGFFIIVGAVRSL